MKALDTNVLIRFLVQDDVNQADKLFSKAEQNKEVLFVPLLVVLEVIWVLQSAYSVTRKILFWQLITFYKCKYWSLKVKALYGILSVVLINIRMIYLIF